MMIFTFTTKLQAIFEIPLSQTTRKHFEIMYKIPSVGKQLAAWPLSGIVPTMETVVASCLLNLMWVILC